MTPLRCLFKFLALEKYRNLKNIRDFNANKVLLPTFQVLQEFMDPL